MSLILDALRKSEAERRRGEIPDLRAELPPAVRSVAPRRRWPFWFAGVAVVVAAIALGWGLWVRTPTPPPVGTAVATPDETPMPETTQLPPEPAVASMSPSIPPASPVRSTPIPGGEPPPVQPVEDDVYAAASAREAPPTTAPNPATQAPPAPEPPASTGTAPRYDAAIANPAPALPPASAASAPAAAAPLPATPPATGAAVRIADLSPGEREQLPALKISMHMFGPTPAERFAIIDGARVTQGDRVGEAVVEEIASDGVVLNWHGRRLSLPLR